MVDPPDAPPSDAPLESSESFESPAESFPLDVGQRAVLRARRTAAAGLLVTAAALTLVLLWVGVVSAAQQGLGAAVLLVASGIWFSPLLIYFAVRRRPAPARAMTLDAQGVTFHFPDRRDRQSRWEDSEFGIVLRDETWRPKSGGKPNALIFLYLRPEVVTSLPLEAVAALSPAVTGRLVEQAERRGVPVLTRPELIGRRAGQHPALVTRLGVPGNMARWIGGRPMGE